MFYSKLENVSDDISFIIPKAYAASFIKKTEFSSALKHCQISYDTELQTGLIEIPNHHNAYEGFKVFLIIILNGRKSYLFHMSNIKVCTFWRRVHLKT